MAATAAGATPEGWTPSSWRSKPIKQQPDFPDADALESALGEGESWRAMVRLPSRMQARPQHSCAVHKLPPIVSAREVLDVRAQLAEVAQGKRFLLQGGDCAERFVDCSSEPIEKKLKILLQMSLILTWGARIPTLRIGRIAGQFAKPRSSPTEVVDGSAWRPGGAAVCAISAPTPRSLTASQRRCKRTKETMSTDTTWKTAHRTPSAS